ncbi:unnamed protein product [Amoebophrya sp. A120]|nr:unnamed protein product [Amoebophrya sp. A120]|eukprot:GSA120T00005798001.1
MRFNAARFAKCRNAHLCPWSQAVNMQFRGICVGAASKLGADLGGGGASRTVMGEVPLQAGFAEQGPGMSSALSGAINFLNANEDLGSSISDEVADAVRQCLGENDLSAYLDLGGMESHMVLLRRTQGQGNFSTAAVSVILTTSVSNITLCRLWTISTFAIW